MMLISAVTTSVIINVTIILIETATPVESSSSSDSSLAAHKILKNVHYVMYAYPMYMYIPHAQWTYKFQHNDIISANKLLNMIRRCIFCCLRFDWLPIIYVV